MRTTQTRKRSRSSVGGYRNKRRKIFRRARRARDKVATNFTRPINRSVPRRLTRRKIKIYKRNLWIATTAWQKWRVAGTASETINTPANLTDYTVKDYRVFRHPIDVTAPSSWVDDNGDASASVVSNSPVYRGGEWRMTIAHENAENVEYRVFLTYNRRLTIAEGTFNKSIVPTAGNESSNEVKICKSWEGTLAPSTSLVLSHRIGITKIDRDRNNNFYDQFGFLVCVGNTVTASAVPVSIVLSTNGWICSDVITP